MTSIFGAFLAAGYAAAFASAIAGTPASEQQLISISIETELLKSYSGAAGVAMQSPEYATKIMAAAKTSFLAGDHWAYIAGIIAILVGGALVFFKFPRKDEEIMMLAKFHAEDTGNNVSNREQA
jgi:DHA2 family multidrug resistance protein-like MFS transporter